MQTIFIGSQSAMVLLYKTFWKTGPNVK